jgi:hypothetical protein
MVEGNLNDPGYHESSLHAVAEESNLPPERWRLPREKEDLPRQFEGTA